MKVALIQICSTLNPSENIDKINRFIIKAKTEEPGLEAVFLPEVFYSMSDGTKPTPYLVEATNEHFEIIRAISMNHNLYVLGGTAATKVGDKVINRNYNFSPSGELIGTYDKIHLFSVNLKGTEKNTIIDEADVYSKGHDLKTINVNNFKIGLSICFDLRFPELYREYHKENVDILSISSAFTVPTGKAHWEVLLRARAIENQAYVIACDQWGQHNKKLSTYGHSMIIDPWGEVIANCEKGEGFACAELSMDKLNKIRTRMNVARQLPT